MAVDLVIPLAALVDERQFEQCADVGALAGQCDEDGDVHGVVLGVLAVGVEVDGPLVATDGESVAGDVLPHSHAFGQRVTSDHELVRAVHQSREFLSRDTISDMAVVFDLSRDQN
ncbi:hypothetical protein U1Q18_011065, partial [Sarracenia purpurea var. burkii]